MPKIMPIITIVFFSILLYQLISLNINNLVLTAFYPFLVALTLCFSLRIIIFNLSKNEILILTIKIITVLLLIISTYTLIQIYRNKHGLNSYQVKQNHYLEKLRDHNLNNPLKELPVTSYNSAKFITNAQDIFSHVLSTITKAENHIHLMYFILRDDHIGQKLKELLIKKSKQGVSVKIIYDALGSYSLSNKYKNELKQAGIKIVGFNNIYHSLLRGEINHRNHRKLLIIDGKIAFIGDTNIADEYIKKTNLSKRDSLQLKIKGEVVNKLQTIFLADWFAITGEENYKEKYFPLPTNIKKQLPLKVVASNFTNRQIAKSYLQLISTAKEKIYIITPYLNLNNNLMLYLKKAIQKEIDITIIVSKKTDSLLLSWLNTSFFKELLTANISIYQYNDKVLHPKLLIIDDHIFSLGSANFNNRGLILDYELNIISYDQKLTKDLLMIIEQYLNKSKKVSKKEYLNPSLIQRIKHLIARFLTPIA